ncbi:DNA adenine methylase, partial [Rhodobacter capsulatus]
LKGRFLLSINDVPEIREIFSWAEIEPVRTTYSIAGKGQSIPAAELLIRGNVR